MAELPPAEHQPRDAAVSDEWIRSVHFDEIDSTQNFVEKEHLSFDQAKLTAVSAGFQTAGRGQGERRWVSARETSVLVTFYFRFPAELPKEFVNRSSPNVTKVLAVAAVETLRELTRGKKLHFGVKWPNDIIVEGGKVGDILARAVCFGGRLEGVIIGIGLNINASAAELGEITRPVWPATSLFVATGERSEFSVVEARERLAHNFAKELRSYFVSGFPGLRERVNALEVLMGVNVRFRVHAKHIVDGTFEGVDDAGLILLRHADGSVKAYPSGEIVPAETTVAE
eukprot:NODE_14334_length_1115_cov_2.363360.p1 GENE.NODE_14334_length_1115_cov_2.363360~~NODE_14334_length_1115_cov_2.363360.p1  ORF type:complete len:297 (-),score=84.05 NODE_14334_length_1115_cov_2.363360:223-1077(-)